MSTTAFTADADLATVDGYDFADALAAARYGSELVAAATSEFGPADLCGHRYFLSADRRSGFAIRESDGELRFVFSLVRGRGDALVTAAVEEGAARLDCFDGYLPRLYARNGFTVVRRERNWTPGGPDVVYMATVEGLIYDGWTVQSAYDHRDGQCDRSYCTADHLYDYSA